MLLNIKIDNYKGVNNNINISCIASNKIKHSNNDISKISEKTKILKNICIIGSNASGKTSILNAIETVQDFLLFPHRKSISNNKDFDSFIKRMTPEELKKFLIDINTLKLGEQNNLRSKDKSTIVLELFIPKRKNNISGIYTYTLMYKSNYKESGVLLEKLEYKKNFDSKKNEVICLANNIIESEITTTLLYQNNNSKNQEKNIDDRIKYYNTFFNEMIKHVSYLDGSEGVDLLEAFNKHGNKFIELCNIADDKIIDVTLDENEKKPKILFWNSKKTFLTFPQLSNGTRKILVIGSIILDALEKNNLLLIDEIELSLHPTLVNFLINLNSSKDFNHFSQLIFTTHSPFVAFSMTNDQLYYINNKNNNYYISSISNAIKNNIITKDKNPEKAWIEDLLIKNPDLNKIKHFLNN